VRGTLTGSFSGLSASSKPFTVHRAAIAQLDRGRVVRLIAFMNGKELAEAIGQWPLQR
jgi:hypothetical protein